MSYLQHDANQDWHPDVYISFYSVGITASAFRTCSGTPMDASKE